MNIKKTANYHFPFLSYYHPRGHKYTRSNNYSIKSNSNYIFEVDFFGTSKYVASIFTPPETYVEKSNELLFQYYCSCPFYEMKNECKHCYALFILFENSNTYRKINQDFYNNEHIYFEAFSEYESLSSYREIALFLKNVKENISWKILLETYNDQSNKKYQKENIYSEVLNSKEFQFNLVIHTDGNFRDKIWVAIFCQTLLKNNKWSKGKKYILSENNISNIKNSKDKKFLNVLLFNATLSYSSYDHLFQVKEESLIELLLMAHEIGWKILITDFYHLKTLPNAEEVKFIPEKFNKKIKIIENKILDKYETDTYVKSKTSQIENYENISDRLFISHDKLQNIKILGYLDEVTFFDQTGLWKSLENIKIDKNEIVDFATTVTRKFGMNLLELPEDVTDQLNFIDITPELHLFCDFSKLSDNLSILIRPYFEQNDEDVKKLPNTIQENKYLNELEKCLYLDLDEEFTKDSDYPWPTYKVNQDNLLLMMEYFQNLNWVILANRQKIKSYSKIEMEVSTGENWFEMNGNLEFNDEVFTMPEILKNAKKNQNYIKLSNDTFGILPKKWLEKQKMLSEVAKIEDGKVLFHHSSALFLDNLLEDHNSQSKELFDQHFKDILEKITNFKSIKKVKPTKSFNGILRPYQNDALNWLSFLNDIKTGGLLADDMGLGKTVQVLSFLQIKKRTFTEPHLVIVPKSLLYNWKSECHKFTPNITIDIYEGSDRESILQNAKKGSIILATYAMIRRDINKFKDRSFDYIILDEAQNIKNSNALTTKAICLLNGKYKLALSGTPVENHLGELFSIFRFLIPHLFGNKIKKDDMISSGEHQELILKSMKPFILRRTKEKVLDDLPQKTEQIIYCELEGNHKKRYNEIKVYYQKKLSKKIEEAGLMKSKMNVLEALLRLRQASCHPKLMDSKYELNDSVKLTSVINHLIELHESGQKALIFSQFTKHLSIVSEKLTELGFEHLYLDGKTKNRQDLVDKFQNDKTIPFFLLSIKAGGVGLNLTSATYAFILDPWWNPAVESQAIDRIHRIGQKNNVTAYRFITKDTVEEKIVKLQDNKRQLSEQLFSSERSFLKNITKDDLQFLLN